MSAEPEGNGASGSTFRTSIVRSSPRRRAFSRAHWTRPLVGVLRDDPGRAMTCQDEGEDPRPGADIEGEPAGQISLVGLVGDKLDILASDRGEDPVMRNGRPAPRSGPPRRAGQLPNDNDVLGRRTRNAGRRRPTLAIGVESTVGPLGHCRQPFRSAQQKHAHQARTLGGRFCFGKTPDSLPAGMDIVTWKVTDRSKVAFEAGGSTADLERR
jgi:hypothetical protein